MTDEGNTTRQVSADGESGVHRLRDIVVEEVSLVDRAANKRRFLVVKRNSEMADDGKSKNRGKSPEGPAGAAPRGGGKKPKAEPDGDVDKARPRVTRAASEEDEEDAETEKARRSRSPQDEEEDDEVDAEKATPEDDEEEGEDEEDEDEDETKAGKTRSRTKAEARVDGDASGQRRQGRTGKPTQKAKGDDLVLSPAMKNAVLRVLAQALERLMAIANQVKGADEPDDDTDANVPDDLTSELEDIGELLEDVGEQLEDPTAKADGKKPGAAKGRAAKAGVAKTGRRMAKDRLDRFQKALEALSSILKELTEAKELPAPGAGSAANPLAKRAAAPGMGELVAGLQELTRVVKHQEDRLVRMQKTQATSNAIPVEGGSRRRNVQDVSWPLDMNRPISRDRVDKAISFYDEE